MRKVLHSLGIGSLCLLLVVAAGNALAGSRGQNKVRGSGGMESHHRVEKVCLCHVPPGNPANAHTICVGSPAVGSHLNHGDTMGSCPVSCGGEAGTPCEEGQFCERPEGECSETSEGMCVDIPTVCPTDLEPVCGCDGTTYNNSCFAAAAGVTVAHVGPCEEPQACGGSTGVTCETGQFCQRPEGECGEEAEGVCVDIPPACPTVIDPVCGCDGTTYDNDCLAAAAGVTVASRGECTTGGVVCGGTAGETCLEGQFCKREEGECSESAEGVCTEQPSECPAIIDPVCGCDGMTYDNECMAEAAGVTVASQGECPAGGEVCGGTAGETCLEGQFCKREEGECSESAEGVCAEVPELCLLVLDPVCGCDGMTYDNECMAEAAGVNVASKGECVEGSEICDDRKDNDGDELIDCADEDCVGDPACVSSSRTSVERKATGR